MNFFATEVHLLQAVDITMGFVLRLSYEWSNFTEFVLNLNGLNDIDVCYDFLN